MVLRLPIWQPSSMKIKRLLNIRAFILEVRSCEMGQRQAVVLSNRRAGARSCHDLCLTHCHTPVCREIGTRVLAFLGPCSGATSQFPLSHLMSFGKSPCRSVLLLVIVLLGCTSHIFVRWWVRGVGKPPQSREAGWLPEGWPLSQPLLGCPVR